MVRRHSSGFVKRPVARFVERRGFCRVRNLVTALVHGCTLAACGPAPPPTTLEDAIEWVDDVRLEESAAVINVTPRVVWANDGTLLISDAQEAQVRRYDAGGRLLATFGGKGQGPGEFAWLTGAIPLTNNTVLATDASGSFATFGADGNVLDNRPASVHDDSRHRARQRVHVCGRGPTNR